MAPAAQDVVGSSGGLRNPEGDNQGLRTAMVRQPPLVLPYGITPGRHVLGSDGAIPAVWPVYVVDEVSGSASQDPTIFGHRSNS